MTEKDRILGVDYADDVEGAYFRGELGDTPLIEQIMDDAAEAGMTHVAWRVSHIGKLTYRTKAGNVQDGHQAVRLSLTPFGLIMKRCDPMEVAVRAAHERGLKLWFYICLYDERYQYATGETTESWLGEQHPEYYSQHFSQPEERVRGVFSLAYPEVKQYFLDIVKEGLDYGSDAVYLDCARTHASANMVPVGGWWPHWTNPYLAYGYNEPDVARYQRSVRGGAAHAGHDGAAGRGAYGGRVQLEPGAGRGADGLRARGEAAGAVVRVGRGGVLQPAVLQRPESGVPLPPGAGAVPCGLGDVGRGGADRRDPAQRRPLAVRLRRLGGVLSADLQARAG